MALAISLLQPDCNLERRRQVVEQSFNPPVAQDQIGLKPDHRAFIKRKGVHLHQMHLTGGGIMGDNQLRVISVNCLYDLAIEIGQTLRIGRSLLRAPVRYDVDGKGATSGFFWNCYIRHQPSVFLRGSPNATGR